MIDSARQSRRDGACVSVGVAKVKYNEELLEKKKKRVQRRIQINLLPPQSYQIYSTDGRINQRRDRKQLTRVFHSSLINLHACVINVFRSVFHVHLHENNLLH